MRQRLTSLAEIVGAAAMSFGFGMIWVPLGVICAGAAAIAFGYMAAD